MNRRGFIGGILAAGMAPVFIEAKILMPGKQISGDKLLYPGRIMWVCDWYIDPCQAEFKL